MSKKDNSAGFGAAFEANIKRRYAIQGGSSGSFQQGSQKDKQKPEHKINVPQKTNTLSDSQSRPKEDRLTICSKQNSRSTRVIPVQQQKEFPKYEKEFLGSQTNPDERTPSTIVWENILQLTLDILKLRSKFRENNLEELCDDCNSALITCGCLEGEWNRLEGQIFEQESRLNQLEKDYFEKRPPDFQEVEELHPIRPSQNPNLRFKYRTAFDYPYLEDPTRPFSYRELQATWSHFHLEIFSPDPFSFQMEYHDFCNEWREWIEKTGKSQGKNDSSQQTFLHQFEQFKTDLRVFILLQKAMNRILSRCLRDVDETSELQSELQEASSFQARNDEELQMVNENMKTSLPLMGRRKILQWRMSAGRPKEWRQVACTKVIMKRQRYNLCQPPRKRPPRSSKTVCPVAHRLGTGGRLFNPAVPAIALKSQALNLPKLSRSKLKTIISSDVRGKRLKNMKKHAISALLDDTPLVATSKPHWKKFSTLPLAEFEASYRQIQLYTSQENPVKPSNNKTGPIAMYFPGEILLYPFRLLSHLRSESHHEVYALDSLTTNLFYEAKVYTLRGIHLNQRKRRVENLKRMTALPSFISSFDWNGKKYCVFEPGVERRLGVERNAKLVVIGRRNTKEYEDAFPALPKKFQPPKCAENNLKMGDILRSDMKEYKVILLKFPKSPLSRKWMDVLLETLDTVEKEAYDEEVNKEVLKGDVLPKPFPLAARVMLRLEKLNPSWQEEVERQLCQYVESMATSQDNPSPQKSRRGRKKKRRVGPVG